MGASASVMDQMASMSLDRAKELAGDLWTEQLEAKFNSIYDEKERVTLNDIKALMPAFFLEPDQKIPIKTVIAVTIAAGQAWNEQLQGIFDAHKTVTSEVADGENSSPAQETIEFSFWKKLVPVLFETSAEREVQ